MLLPIGISIVAWFVVAPSPRYATPLFWSLAAVLVCRVFILTRDELSASKGRLVAASVLIALLSPATAVIREANLRDSSYLSAFLSLYVVSPGPDHGFHPVNPAPDTKPFVTDSGLVLNTPDRNTPGVNTAKCWNLPLPCTPNPAANLQLRVPGELGRGFRVVGDWNMQDWPYYWRGNFLEEWRARRK